MLIWFISFIDWWAFLLLLFACNLLKFAFFERMRGKIKYHFPIPEKNKITICFFCLYSFSITVLLCFYSFLFCSMSNAWYKNLYFYWLRWFCLFRWGLCGCWFWIKCASYKVCVFIWHINNVYEEVCFMIPPETGRDYFSFKEREKYGFRVKNISLIPGKMPEDFFEILI